jgi:hypothetical protein
MKWACDQYGMGSFSGQRAVAFSLTYRIQVDKEKKRLAGVNLSKKGRAERFWNSRLLIIRFGATAGAGLSEIDRLAEA